MIKRNYFMAGVKFHNDGKGSYSVAYVQYEYKSIFADPTEAFIAGHKSLKNSLQHALGGDVVVTSFNRC